MSECKFTITITWNPVLDALEVVKSLIEAFEAQFASGRGGAEVASLRVNQAALAAQCTHVNHYGQSLYQHPNVNPSLGFCRACGHCAIWDRGAVTTSTQIIPLSLQYTGAYYGQPGVVGLGEGSGYGQLGGTLSGWNDTGCSSQTQVSI